MKPYTYTRAENDPMKVRYKHKHTATRMIELHIALRNIGDEIKELADFMQMYSLERSGRLARNQRAAEANVRAEPPKAQVVVLKQPPPKEDEEREDTKLDQFQKEIVRWLISAPTDPPEEIAPLIPAPLSMVKRIRTKLVDAGRLRRLDEPPHQDNGEKSA